MALKQHQRLGETVWSRMPRVNSEIFTLTYGALVMQLLKDYEEVEAVNAQLEKIGHNIGVRLIDEFLSKSNIAHCSNYRETADVIAKVAFKMFLGITCEVTNWNQESTAFSLMLPSADQNPLIEFVEVPPKYAELCYCNILCGVVKGALEMIQVDVDVKFVNDVLRGDDCSELRVECRGAIETVMSDEYKEN